VTPRDLPLSTTTCYTQSLALSSHQPIRSSGKVSFWRLTNKQYWIKKR